MLALYDTAHSSKTPLDNYADLYVEQAIGSGSTPIVLDQLHFTYPLEDECNKLIDYECYVSTEDDEYIVKEINLQTTDSGITWVEYVCDLNIEPLKGTLIDNFAPGNVAAEDAANLALAGTGWAVGYCDITKVRTAAQTQCTVLDALTDISTAYACEITFDTTNHLVNLHIKQGADRGAYFAEQLNLKTLQVQGNSRDYVTRIYPVGKDGMTIASVNGGVSYISNYQYSTKVVEAYWIDNRYTVASDMLADADERLNYLSMPTRAYSADIVDLARESDKWNLLDFSLGDFIWLLSESTGVREQQRIVKIDRYLEEPERSTCEIANRIASLDDIILRVSDAADTLSDATDSTGAIQGSSVQVTNPDGTYSSLNATVATIGTLIATKATITDLQAAQASIQNLQADKADITDLTANYITADTISSTYATIENLNVQEGRINDLVSNEITTDYLNANYADINLANVASGTINTALIATGAIQTAQIADGSITDAKIVTLTASKLTAGTIDAGEIDVVNLHADEITVGTINGAQIAGNTITDGNLADNAVTTDKIAVGAITADQIAQGAVTSDKIAAGSIKESQLNWQSHLLY